VCLVQPREDVWLLFDAAATDDRATHVITDFSANNFTYQQTFGSAVNCADSETDRRAKRGSNLVADCASLASADTVTASCDARPDRRSYTSATHTRPNLESHRLTHIQPNPIPDVRSFA